MDGAQVAQLAQNVGLKGQALQTAVAIANAESGFNERAHGDVNIGGSWGLWQVYIPAHPQYTPEQLMDPVQNAAAMYEISGGGENWNPWSTYWGGQYLSYMGDAAEYVGQIGNRTGDVATGLSPQDADALAKVSTVVNFALGQVGKPYRYGGAGPDDFDCSGLTMAAYATIGIALPHDMALQATYGVEVPRDQVAAGDIVTMDGSDGYNGHGGMAVGADQYVVARQTGTNIEVLPIPWDRINNVRRLVEGGSSSFWSKLRDGIAKVGSVSILDIGSVSGLDVLGIKSPLDAAKSALSTVAKAGAWIGNRHNILRILQVFGGILAAIMGISIISKTVGGGSAIGAVKETAGSAKNVALLAATKGAA